MSHLNTRLKSLGRFHISRYEFQSGAGLLGNGFEGGFSRLEAEVVVDCMRREAEAAEVVHHVRRVAIVEEQREFQRARSAARHGWDCDIESLEDFAARPHKGTRADGSEHTRRPTSEEWKADEIQRAEVAAGRDLKSFMAAVCEEQVDDETRSYGPIIE